MNKETKIPSLEDLKPTEGKQTVTKKTQVKPAGCEKAIISIEYTWQGKENEECGD